jgi:hypothetical protein
VVVPKTSTGVAVYHCYEDDAFEAGPMFYWFTLSAECGDGICRDEKCRDGKCRMVFDIRDVPGYNEDDEPPGFGKPYWSYCKKLLLAAIKAGHLTKDGTNFPPPPPEPVSIGTEMFNALKTVQQHCGAPGGLLTITPAELQTLQQTVDKAITRYEREFPVR